MICCGNWKNTNSTFTITLPISFTTTKYHVTYGAYGARSSGWGISTTSKSKTQISGIMSSPDQSNDKYSDYIAMGI